MRTIIDNATALFKQSLGEIADTLDRRDLSPELVTSLAKDLLAASAAAARAFFRDVLQDRDTDAPLVEHEGRRFRRKSLSKRTVLTFLGPVSLERGLYQQDRGGAAFFRLTRPAASTAPSPPPTCARHLSTSWPTPPPRNARPFF